MKNTKNDKCVMCGRYTSYNVDTPVEIRENYVVGIGQLCEDCYTSLDIYISPNVYISKKDKTKEHL